MNKKHLKKKAVAHSHPLGRRDTGGVWGPGEREEGGEGRRCLEVRIQNNGPGYWLAYRSQEKPRGKGVGKLQRGVMGWETDIIQ